MGSTPYIGARRMIMKKIFNPILFWIASIMFTHLGKPK